MQPTATTLSVTYRRLSTIQLVLIDSERIERLHQRLVRHCMPREAKCEDRMKKQRREARRTDAVFAPRFPLAPPLWFFVEFAKMSEPSKSLYREVYVCLESVIHASLRSMEKRSFAVKS